jgi:hypothetical protein
MTTVADIPEGSEAHLGAFLAQHYHGGQMTALYALASSGSFELFPGEGLGRIIRELTEAVRIAETDHPDDVESLSALLAWCEDRHGSEGVGS